MITEELVRHNTGNRDLTGYQGNGMETTNNVGEGHNRTVIEPIGQPGRHHQSLYQRRTGLLASETGRP
jgi:hypothetical protein